MGAFNIVDSCRNQRILFKTCVCLIMKTTVVVLLASCLLMEAIAGPIVSPFDFFRNFGKKRRQLPGYGQAAPAPAACRNVCRNVPRQQCQNVPRQVPRQECQQVPRQQCQNVPRQEARQECQQIPRQVCNNVPRQQCQNVPRQECQNVPRQVAAQECQNVPRQVSRQEC